MREKSSYNKAVCFDQCSEGHRGALTAFWLLRSRNILFDLFGNILCIWEKLGKEGKLEEIKKYTVSVGSGVSGRQQVNSLGETRASYTAAQIPVISSLPVPTCNTHNGIFRWLVG